MQDDCRELSKALSKTPHARLNAREAADSIADSAAGADNDWISIIAAGQHPDEWIYMRGAK